LDNSIELMTIASIMYVT